MSFSPHWNLLKTEEDQVKEGKIYFTTVELAQPSQKNVEFAAAKSHVWVEHNDSLNVMKNEHDVGSSVKKRN